MKLINLARIDFGGIATGGGNAKPEEVFDVQPTTAEQTITPTEGSVFSGGTVRAVTSEIDVNIASNNIKEGVTILGVEGTLKEEKPEESFNVQPTTAEQIITPTEGSVFSGGTVHAVTSAIDSNIQPENIKEGVRILGVAGTLEEGITPAGTKTITDNGTYDVTTFASVDVEVSGDTPDYHYMNGTVDRAGLKAIGWTDEDILMYEQNITPHYPWQNDQYKLNDENKALYLLDDPNPESYKDNPNIEFVPNKNMGSYFAKPAGFKLMKYIKGIPFYDTSNMTDMSDLFYYCNSLITIPKLDTSKVTTMARAFNECNSLITIPRLDTSNVQSMYATFSNCSNLTTIPLLDTSNVTSMSSIFSGCKQLTTIPLLDTSNVTDMYGVFYVCINLTSIPQLDTSKVTTMADMFYGCYNLTTIPLLDTSNVTSMSDMFFECKKLTTIPQLDTSKVTTMSEMFQYCYDLTSIPQLDTSNVKYMSKTFYNCSSLTTIPSLNTSNVVYMEDIFYSCYDLTTVEGIDFSGLTSELTKLFGWDSTKSKVTRFIVNGKINVSISDNYSIKPLTAIDYDSIKSILAAADRTDNTNAKELAFNRTMTDQNGELAALVASCTSKGWTISGLTLQ